MAKVSQAHLEARRRSILEAAARVFSQKGIAAATMAEIAHEAGISPGAIYRYFASKEELARAGMAGPAEAVKAAWEHPEQVETGFAELSRATFAALELPGADLDTRLLFERALVAVRDEDAALLHEFGEELGRILRGVAFLLKRDFGERLEGWDVEALAQALYSFYWGARFVQLMAPGAPGPVRQLEALQRLMEAAFGRQQEQPAG
ncbi:helix-turn-helix domain containing protein [Tepidiforma flava]|uniref:Helix-turn-helix domain containing protein n=1 Tax=Tepidiforma flava TaxID=3004094 RepID=A0ABY7M924_9CHLR|nr:TetR/AcrR family transcriptional regulator [Tepidiforma flava]WBL37026.1 helix-turn-helix domain containing protein [Tepidiforma flava]